MVRNTRNTTTVHTISQVSIYIQLAPCMRSKMQHRYFKLNPLGALIEIRNLTTYAMLVINCEQSDANELSAFLRAHHCFTAHKAGPSLVSRFLQLL